MAKAPKTKAGNANNTGGGPNKTFAQKPIPGPERTGGPVSLQKALKKKPMSSKGCVTMPITDAETLRRDAGWEPTMCLKFKKVGVKLILHQHWTHRSGKAEWRPVEVEIDED